MSDKPASEKPIEHQCDSTHISFGFKGINPITGEMIKDESITLVSHCQLEANHTGPHKGIAHEGGFFDAGSEFFWIK